MEARRYTFLRVCVPFGAAALWAEEAKERLARLSQRRALAGPDNLAPRASSFEYAYLAEFQQAKDGSLFGPAWPLNGVLARCVRAH